MPASAKIICDSISPNGDRLTTLEMRFHRFVLAEFNTHRSHSRNSASSRAIPVAKQIAAVRNDPAIPLDWGSNIPGMQAGEALHPDAAQACLDGWLRARDVAADTAERLSALGLHKQVANRLLEPFMWHTVIASATDDGWLNFFDQRCSPLAQPEIRAVADLARAAWHASEPEALQYGEFHLPYVDDEERAALPLETQKEISVARCARVSYLTHDGRRDVTADMALYRKLLDARPVHWSPLEHVARPASRPDTLGNFTGWSQLRHITATRGLTRRLLSGRER